jgi:NAD(P)-dependent dehydrogenase (short-subunit alcohol dehydrogenase family)
MTATPLDAHSTAADAIRGIDLRGKTALVTGSSSGLGAETARVLAGAGATVLMAARDADKNARAMAAIRAEVPAAQLEAVALDLGDPASVRRAAAQILAAHPQLHLLINNAGVMACPLARTANGCEAQFATNHIGHFLLSCLLVPALRRAAPARVVSLSSAAHRYQAMDFDDPQFERRPYTEWAAYGQSKTANALFAAGLGRRLRPFGITVNAVHPGVIFTDLMRHMSAADLDGLRERAGGLLKSVPQGAATQVWAAVSPELADVSGCYLEDCHIGRPVTAPTQMDGYMPYALDAAAAEQLWTLSERIVGERFAWAV